MSDRPARIVYARPPTKGTAPRPGTPVALAKVTEPVAPVVSPLTPIAALAVFQKMIDGWEHAARAGGMLPPVGYQAGSLTVSQAERVATLVAIDADM